MTWRVVTSLAALAALALPVGQAGAQESLRLRASEFSSFSRVVLDLPPDAAWEVDRAGRALTLRLPNIEAEVDSAAIFPERRVSRVLRATASTAGGGSEITFSMSCACEADVYRLGPRSLVLDFRDGAREEPPTADAPSPVVAEARPAPRAAAPAPAAPAPAPAAQAPAPDAGDAPARAAVDHGDDHAPTAGAQDHAAEEHAPTDPAAETPAPSEAGDDAHAADTPPAAPLDDVASVVAEAQRRLIEQLSRAAEEGLVEFSERPQAPPAEEPQAPPHDAPAEAHGDDHAADPHAAEPDAQGAPDAAPDGDPMAAMLEAARGQVEIRSVIERDRPRRAPTPDHCIADPRFTLPVLEASEDPAVAIATRRVGLMDAVDEIVRPAAAELARVYIALGFGAEARAVIGTVAPPLRAGPLLTDMAHVVDGEPYAEGGPLSTQKDCPGLAAVWRLSAANGDGAEVPDTVPAADALAAALAEISPPLRHRIGARLLTNLLEGGRLEAARRVASIMERAPGPRSPERTLAMAKLDIAEGKDAQADRALRRIAGGSSPAGAEATALLIERLLGQGRQVEQVLIQSAAAAALAHRGTPLGDRLKAAEIRARGGDRFIPAMDVLETEVERGEIGDQTLRMVAQELYLAAGPERDGDVEYAGAAIARAGLMGDGPDSDAARTATADRLTRIGLANAALGMVAPSVARHDPAALAAARAHVALGDGDAALELVGAQDGAAAQKVRVAALVAEGRHAEAWEAVASGEGVDPETRSRFAWRAGEWRAAAALAPSPARSTFAAWASGAAPEAAAELAPSLSEDALAAMGPPPDTQEPSLSGARALIARSRTAESFIEEALRDG
ncbi:hypothetical protein ACQ5SO_02555 [Rhodovulum sp. DZ06]|uniref:hypothetical protein n=1 Tax=Rhodovulum sp. DZ06 TaxID=3425126 RepID=UPI003D353843